MQKAAKGLWPRATVPRGCRQVAGKNCTVSEFGGALHPAVLALMRVIRRQSNRQPTPVSPTHRALDHRQAPPFRAALACFRSRAFTLSALGGGSIGGGVGGELRVHFVFLFVFLV